MDAWQIQDTVAFIVKHKATKIGLQFPDHLLKHASSITHSLKEELANLSDDNDYKLYIMADTTFAPCCVDEIAAQHVHGEVIIHYGWTCCSPTNRTPVLHVLGRKTMNIQLFTDLLFTPKVFDTLFISFKKILILYEPHYSHYKDTFINLCKHKDVEFFVTDIHNESSLRSKIKNDDDNEEKKQSHDSSTQRHFCGFYYDALLDNEQWNTLLTSDDFSINNIKQNYAVLYIGNDVFDEYEETSSSEHQLFLSLLTNFGSCFQFISYNPDKVEAWIGDKETDKMEHVVHSHTVDEIFGIKQNEALLNKMLMYRYSLIEKVRSSGIIGIVCSNLVVDNYLDIIKTLKQTVKQAGKKPYLFSIGKINEAKLGNFSEIDIFVVITCPMSFHYLLPVQQQSLFKNLVTPFDIMLALNDNDGDSKAFKWTGMYSTDFNDVLNHSYKMGGVKPSQSTRQSKNNDNKTVAIRGKGGRLVKTATNYMLEKRTWKGVEVVSDDLAPSKIEQGLSGIASQYKGEYK
eukprot:60470_1